MNDEDHSMGQMDISSTIKFPVICDMLQKIKDADVKRQKLKIIQQYYNSFCRHRKKFRGENNLSSEEDGSSSFYCILRCLIPRTDKGRPSYNLQIPSLSKVYINILQLDGNSKDAEILQANRYNPFYGDYAKRVYKVLKPRCRQEFSDFTLKGIHDMLDVIANGDRIDAERILTQLTEKASASEQKWFIRLLLKSMHLSLNDHDILGVIDVRAKHFMQKCQNLAIFCCKLADNKLEMIPSKNVEDNSNKTSSSGIKLFEVIRPQLCQTFPGNIETLMAEDVLYMEIKMDGERFHIHYSNGCFKYISRNGCDFTRSFGDTSNVEGKLTSRLCKYLPEGLQSIILDGEMMVWDKRRKRFREKSENTDVKHLTSDDSCQPCYVAFDLLYFNGQSLLEVPYIQRMHKMHSVLKEGIGTFQLMYPKKIISAEDFKNWFQQSLDNQLEGVVVKKQNAVYRPGSRNGGGWYKLKADYINGLTTEFDLLIMGGFYNRQRSYVESFLMGVLQYKSSDDFEIWSVGKVANITQQRKCLNDTLKSRWHLIEQDPPPMWYHYEKNNAEGRPDVWIEPNQSFILQIKATDLNLSSAFSVKMSLHFPRIVAWRNDKLWYECFTFDEYQEIVHNYNEKSLRKIVKRPVSLEDLRADRVKRKKLTPAQKRKLSLLAYEKKFPLDQIEILSGLLQGFSVCILSGYIRKDITVEYLKTMVVQNGGTAVENPLPNNAKCIVVAGDKNYRVQKLCQSQQYDIVTADWFISYCQKKKQKPDPLDMLAITDLLKDQFTQFYDKYGDHYTEKLNSTKDLKRIIDNMNTDDLCDLSDQDLKEIEREIYGLNQTEKPNFFRYIVANFYTCDMSTKSAELLYKWHGGEVFPNQRELTVCDKSIVNFIFINALCLNKQSFRDWLQRSYADYLSQLQIVKIEWIFESHKLRKLLDVNEYSWHDF